jgi:hypothetical protein
MTKTMKPRINDVIVIETRSSSTDAKMKTTKYSTFFFAYVAKVDRKGIVSQYRKEEKAYPVMLDHNQRVMTILDADRQADARVAFKTVEQNFFTDADDVRNLIMSARAAA